MYSAEHSEIGLAFFSGVVSIASSIGKISRPVCSAGRLKRKPEFRLTPSKYTDLSFSSFHDQEETMNVSYIHPSFQK